MGEKKGPVKNQKRRGVMISRESPSQGEGWRRVRQILHLGYL
jgi:hypothetical protein